MNIKFADVTVDKRPLTVSWSETQKFHFYNNIEDKWVPADDADSRAKIETALRQQVPGALPPRLGTPATIIHAPKPMRPASIARLDAIESPFAESATKSPVVAPATKSPSALPIAKSPVTSPATKSPPVPTFESLTHVWRLERPNRRKPALSAGFRLFRSQFRAANARLVSLGGEKELFRLTQKAWRAAPASTRRRYDAGAKYISQSPGRRNFSVGDGGAA